MEYFTLKYFTGSVGSGRGILSLLRDIFRRTALTNPFRVRKPRFAASLQASLLLTSRLTSLRLDQKISEANRQLERELASLKLNMTNFLAYQKTRAEKAYDSLSLIDPEKIIKRGFAIARTADQKVVKSTQDVKTGDQLSLEVSDGLINVEVKNG